MSDVIVKMKMTPSQAGRMYMKCIELEKIVKKLGDACDKIHKEKSIIQPFLSIWKEHGDIIEKCRNK